MFGPFGFDEAFLDLWHKLIDMGFFQQLQDIDGAHSWLAGF